MVESAGPASPLRLGASETDRRRRLDSTRSLVSCRWGRIAVLGAASILAVTTVITVTTVLTRSPHRTSSASSSIPIAARTTPSTTGAARGTSTTPPLSDPLPAIAAAAAPITPSIAVAPAAGPSSTTVPAAAQPVAVEPPIATLVAEVEATGIEPGSNWSWSMGDTAPQCGPLSGAGTGCTFGAGGLEYTVFAGSPNLSLVAHELANAETQNDAVPNLLSEVAAAAGGSSWSPTDAVASCLVAHFVGIQDDAAGVWVCPAALATLVADNIHDTLSTTVGTIPG